MLKAHPLAEKTKGVAIDKATPFILFANNILTSRHYGATFFL